MSKIKYCTYVECPACHGNEYVRARTSDGSRNIIKTCRLCRERTIRNWKRLGLYAPDGGNIYGK